jgi:hypothetical protein
MSTLAPLVIEAKKDPGAAEKKLLPIMQRLFPKLQVEAVSINRGSKVSLNSVNGILRGVGQAYFFKFHAEEGEAETLENSEYYRAKMLIQLGWPVIEPLAVSHTPGEQCVVYPKLEAPTAYDLLGAQDARFLETGAYDDAHVELLLEAERSYLRKTTQISLSTLQKPSAELKDASLHQLFAHRLIAKGKTPARLDQFYTGKSMRTADGEGKIGFDELAQMKWRINGVVMEQSLATIIDLSKKQLAPENTAKHASIVSHGDDHNGNKLLVGKEFISFDPAFAGRHPALLGLIKGTMHNTLLHPFWYYEPERVNQKLKISLAIQKGKVDITYNAADVLHSPLREAALDIYLAEVWQPVLARLKTENLVPDDWKDFIRCAAFCCPFLALNMIDQNRVGGELSFFNLAQCIALFHAPHIDKLSF